MKKFFLLAVLSLSLFASRAQVQFGARAGVNISSIHGKDVDGYRSKPGFHAGAFANIPVMTALRVRPEVYFSSQGARWEEKGDKTVLNYLQIPVLAQYQVAERFYAEAGPQVGFLLSARDTYDGESTDIKKYLKTTDFAFVIGAGYQVNNNIGVNARYNFGIAKLYDEEKNCLFQVGATYTFATRK